MTLPEAAAVVRERGVVLESARGTSASLAEMIAGEAIRGSVHRRLWPALVRLASHVPRERLAKVREIHTDSGRHRVELTPFPRWVTADVRREAASMSEARARAELGPWL